MDEDFPITSQEESSNPKKGKTADWLTCMKSDRVQTLLAGTQIPLKRQEPITSQLTPGIGPMVTQRICLIYSKNSLKRLAYWVSLFLKYNGHGRDQSIYSRPITFFSLNPRDSDS